MMPIGSFLKGLSLAAVLMSVPAFAVVGLVANTSSSSVELSSEHDPLRNGFRYGTTPSARGTQPLSTPEEINSSNWQFTIKPVPSPTPLGYTFP
jgi:hypothetical protein